MFKPKPGYIAGGAAAVRVETCTKDSSDECPNRECELLHPVSDDIRGSLYLNLCRSWLEEPVDQGSMEDCQLRFFHDWTGEISAFYMNGYEEIIPFTWKGVSQDPLEICITFLGKEILSRPTIEFGVSVFDIGGTEHKNYVKLNLNIDGKFIGLSGDFFVKDDISQMWLRKLTGPTGVPAKMEFKI
jgi:hypothetical protein